jgi:hypothetical protein
LELHVAEDGTSGLRRFPGAAAPSSPIRLILAGIPQGVRCAVADGFVGEKRLTTRLTCEDNHAEQNVIAGPTARMDTPNAPAVLLLHDY